MSFTVYRSSAGSGKTYTLVKEYLKIALGTEAPDTYRSILAITFTNKAANEMKERVLSALQDLYSEEEPTGSSRFLVLDIRKESGLDPEVIRKRSKRVLAHLLHHYSDFAISTIDKFVDECDTLDRGTVDLCGVLKNPAHLVFRCPQKSSALAIRRSG